MGIQFELYPVMATRPCSFCLSLQGGSVFADFDVDDRGVVSLCRISFDGYGCCHVEKRASEMSSDNSRQLTSALAAATIANRVSVSDILRRYFRENTAVLWPDALADHKLL